MRRILKKSLIIATDAFLVVLSYWLSYAILTDFAVSMLEIQVFHDTFIIILGIVMISFFAFHQYSILWRYASVNEFINAIIANTIASTVISLLNFIFGLGLSNSNIIVAFLLTLTFTLGIRFMFWLFGQTAKKADTLVNPKRVMIVGAGEAGTIILKELKKHKQNMYKPVIIIDDDPEKDKSTISGVKIALGTAKIPEYVQKYKIDEIIVAIPSAPMEVIGNIAEVCKKTNCSIKVIPGFDDLLSGKINHRLVNSHHKDRLDNKVWLSSPHMSDEGYEIHYVQEAFDTNWVSTVGKNVTEFEREVAERVDIQYAVALVSGTSAIHMALKAAGVGEGDIVLCQDLTFSATANPIIYQRAIPVFIDSDLKTWNMDPEQLEIAFLKYPKAKAVICVHLFGLACDMERIVSICKKHEAVLIEDAAESLGSFYKGKHTGTFGDYGIFSFNGNKIITTSGGGVLVSNNKEKISKVYSWATQSRESVRYYQHSELGFNYRMSNIVAGIGRGQLKVLDQRIAKKKYIFDYYKRNLSHLTGLGFMPINEWNDPNCWLTCITVTNSKKPIDIIEALETENIEARHLWKPMHMQPFFEQYDFIGNGISQSLFEIGVCLPSDTKMTDEDLNRVVKAIQKCWDS